MVKYCEKGENNYLVPFTEAFADYDSVILWVEKLDKVRSLQETNNEDHSSTSNCADFFQDWKQGQGSSVSEIKQTQPGTSWAANSAHHWLLHSENQKDGGHNHQPD